MCLSVLLGLLSQQTITITTKKARKVRVFKLFYKSKIMASKLLNEYNLNKKVRAQMKAAIFSALLLASGTASADLADWQIDGNGSWTYNETDNSWFQSTNTPDFTFLYDPSNTSIGNAVSGSIEVATTNDDDFIGFALGYSQGESTSDLADYWLVSWKKRPQSGWEAGLSLWHITGNINNDPWNPSNNADVTLIQKANNYGSTGWVSNQNYTFDLTYTEGSLAVFIDEELELAVSAKDAGVSEFEDGGFGYFNFSQDTVYYYDVEYDAIDTLIDDEQKNAIVSAVPVAGLGFASLFMIGAAGATNRRRKASK